MRKLNNILSVVFLFALLVVSACQPAKKDSEHIKKVQLSEETIAVGIYKPAGVELNNIQYIAEAINIDVGMVYVTLTDSDVLRTKLENIDVVVFPEMKNDKSSVDLDNEVASVFKDFIQVKGKGALGFSNGASVLTQSEGDNSLNLIDLKIDNSDKKEKGLLDFDLTVFGKEMFPELKDMIPAYINYNSDILFEIPDNEYNEAVVLAHKKVNDEEYPIFIISKCGRGKLFLLAAHPETTPGMRWMIPRMIRWVNGKEPAWYEKNIVRPGMYNQAFVFTDEVLTKVDQLKSDLINGSKAGKMAAMDEMQNNYPWLAAEQVKVLLADKSNDVKLRAAKYLVDIEYTFAIKDLESAIKKSRRGKVKEQLIEYKNLLERMTEQN